MSTDILPWPGRTAIDSPLRRIYWTLPVSLLICAFVFFWFTYFLEHSARRPPEPVPVDAELIELPAPTEKSTAQPVHKVVQQPRIKQSKPTPEPTPEPMPRKDVPIEKPITTPSVSPPPATPSREQANVPLPTESRGAQAITQPLPVIPDDLREDALNDTATARFHIAIDGSVTVDLVKPTQNPRLNRLLLDTLRNWKFFPAMKEGKPVPSDEVLVIRVLVQ